MNLSYTVNEFWNAIRETFPNHACPIGLEKPIINALKTLILQKKKRLKPMGKQVDQIEKFFVLKCVR